MSEDVSANEGPFDLEKLKELIEMMERHGLTEVSLRRGDEKWRLRRGPTHVMPSNAFPTSVEHPAASVPLAESKEDPSDSTVEIKSPTVGTYYAAPTPDDPPFIKVGSQVQPDTIVCIVEAMKVFNQIPAEISGTIVKILVNTGDSVEFGQPLYRVRPD